jgi:predicted nucleic-acid-binding Zn-ribbon protein
MSPLNRYFLRCPWCGIPHDFVIHNEIMQIYRDEYIDVKCKKCGYDFKIKLDNRFYK